MKKPVAKPKSKSSFVKSIRTSANLETKGLEMGKWEYHSVLNQLYIDAGGNLCAEAECGQECLVANTKGQMREIAEFLAEICGCKVVAK